MEKMVRARVLDVSRRMRHPVRGLLAAAAIILACSPMLHSAPAAAKHAPYYSAFRPLTEASSDVEPPIAIALIKAHGPQSLSSDAQALAADVNATRAQHGLQPLQRDPALDRIAFAKGVEMAARGYFGHTSPDGITFQDRMRAANWPTAYVAENIAFDRSEPHANAAFVASPDHYSNLVDPRERSIGVAVINVGPGETFYVEDFSGS